MKFSAFITLFLLLHSSAALAANVVRQTIEIENSANPRVGCQNPRFNFTRQDMEICLGVYQGCMRPELKLAEREQCVVEAVRKARAAGGPGAGAASQGPKKDSLDFSFNSFQAYDLIEICEQKQNKNRPLCAGAILPNKARIISDINKARQ